MEEFVAKSRVPENVKVKAKIQKEELILISDTDILKRIFGNLINNAA
jgi:nitrogen fixation/metabolism regulation signal transduction histidine kinase